MKLRLVLGVRGAAHSSDPPLVPNYNRYWPHLPPSISFASFKVIKPCMDGSMILGGAEAGWGTATVEGLAALFCQIVVTHEWPIQVGTRYTPPLSPKSFILMQFSAQFWKVIGCCACLGSCRF